MIEQQNQQNQQNQDQQNQNQQQQQDQRRASLVDDDDILAALEAADSAPPREFDLPRALAPEAVTATIAAATAARTGASGALFRQGPADAVGAEPAAAEPAAAALAPTAAAEQTGSGSGSSAGGITGLLQRAWEGFYRFMTATAVGRWLVGA